MARGVAAWLVLLFGTLSACTAPLLPGERVIGAEVPATFTYGREGSQLGAVVGTSTEGRWLATAPGVGELWDDGQALAEPARFATFWGEMAVWGEGSAILAESGEIWVVRGKIAAMAASSEGVFVATENELYGLGSGWVLPVRGVSALATGEERLLGLGAEGVLAWTFSGEALGKVTDGGPGGAVGEWEGVAWGGAPEWTDDEAGGAVYAEDGQVIEGEAGDHLGGAIGGGYTTGTFNRLLTPQRARLVPLDGGDVLALDQGAERQPLALSGVPGMVVLGAPYQPHSGANAGAVVVVRP